MAANLFSSKAKVRPDMNVTPLVDIVLVLLIIFMVLAPVMMKSFTVRLPPKDELDEKIEALKDQPLVLRVESEGQLKVNGNPVERDELTIKLQRWLNARPDRMLYLDAGDEARYGSVLEAMDLARAAGAHPVVMLTKKLE